MLTRNSISQPMAISRTFYERVTSNFILLKRRIFANDRHSGKGQFPLCYKTEVQLRMGHQFVSSCPKSPHIWRKKKGGTKQKWTLIHFCCSLLLWLQWAWPGNISINSCHCWVPSLGCLPGCQRFQSRIPTLMVFGDRWFSVQVLV